MKKSIKFIAGIVSACALFCSCGTGNDSGANGASDATSDVKIDLTEFESDNKFITFADLPPDAFSEKALSAYKDLGMTVCLLGEDFVSFTDKQGNITDGYKKSIENIEKSGMEVWIRNYRNSYDYFQNDSEKEGSNYGIPYTRPVRNITTELQEYSGLSGFYMADEPYMYSLEDNPATTGNGYDESLFAALDQYDELIKWKNQYYPDDFFHMNMVPSSSIDHYKGYTYEQFIRSYVDNIVKKLTSGGRSVCLDNYPFGVENKTKISDSYLSDILTAARVCKEYNDSAEENQKATFGICLQTFENMTSSVKLKDIECPEEVTFQMYTGMATGANLFEYFCYRSIAGMKGILDDNGNARIYDIVKSANESALWYASVLGAFEWQGIRTSFASVESQIENRTAFDIVQNYVVEDAGCLGAVSSKLDTLVGCFKKGEQDGYMFVNYTAPYNKETDIVTVGFNGKTKVAIYQGGEVKVVPLAEGKIRLTLKAGDAAFVIPV